MCSHMHAGEYQLRADEEALVKVVSFSFLRPGDVIVHVTLIVEKFKSSVLPVRLTVHLRPAEISFLEFFNHQLTCKLIAELVTRVVLLGYQFVPFRFWTPEPRQSQRSAPGVLLNSLNPG